ncbi:hypothetical protein POM88_014063 [Heracleum sosnowskyi]|uniref:Uncharacterized protein n=1 Tax=Heracleum sosnowskyi TaxID=360622 RepID=A0AAD8J308_9APIA|nr:hypothetical protein POM88_014063 [Heracleum sosnowskyi]
MNRNNADAEFAFKMGLGEAFYHGVNVLLEKNAIITDQDNTVKKWKGEASSCKSQLVEVQKKLDAVQAMKDEVEKVQAALNKLSVESKIMGEALKSENAKMKKELTELKASTQKELSDA